MRVLVGVCVGGGGGEWRRGDRVVVNEGEEGFLSSKQTGFSFFYLKFFLKDKFFFFNSLNMVVT